MMEQKRFLICFPLLSFSLEWTCCPQSTDSVLFCAKKVSGGGHSLNTNPTHIFNHIPECHYIPFPNTLQQKFSIFRLLFPRIVFQKYSVFFVYSQQFDYGILALVMAVISYRPFYETLYRKGITEYYLIYKQGISPTTIHRMKHGKGITTATLVPCVRFWTAGWRIFWSTFP